VEEHRPGLDGSALAACWGMWNFVVTMTVSNSSGCHISSSSSSFVPSSAVGKMPRLVVGWEHLTHPFFDYTRTIDTLNISLWDIFRVDKLVKQGLGGQ
jgi:hypothetical protein